MKCRTPADLDEGGRIGCDPGTRAAEPEGKSVKESAQPLPPARPRFKPYPAYKGSGVEWLGKIPAHWEVKKVRTAATLRRAACRNLWTTRSTSTTRRDTPESHRIRNCANVPETDDRKGYQLGRYERSARTR